MGHLAFNFYKSTVAWFHVCACFKTLGLKLKDHLFKYNSSLPMLYVGTPDHRIKVPLINGTCNTYEQGYRSMRFMIILLYYRPLEQHSHGLLYQEIDYKNKSNSAIINKIFK